MIFLVKHYIWGKSYSIFILISHFIWLMLTSLSILFGVWIYSCMNDGTRAQVRHIIIFSNDGNMLCSRMWGVESMAKVIFKMKGNPSGSDFDKASGLEFGTQSDGS